MSTVDSGPGPAGPERSASAVSYFQFLDATFDAMARAAGGPVDRYYDLGGIRVLVRVAAPALASVTRAFDHRRTEPGEASLVVCVGVGGVTPDPPPVLARAAEWSVRRRPSAVDVDDEGPIRATYVETTGAVNMLDGGRRRAIVWLPDPGEAGLLEGAAPLLHVFSWWLGRHGRYPVHAGAVGNRDGGVLLVGKGGAGKSTTALACLDSDLLHAADDYVLIAEHPPFAHSLYQSARLHTDQVPHLPRVAAAMNAPARVEHRKLLLFLDQKYALKVAAGFPIRAVLIPRVTGQRDTRLISADAAQALDALLPSSVVQVPGLGREGVRAIARIVRSVPNYSLEVGTDLTQIPAVISRLLAGRPR